MNFQIMIISFNFIAKLLPLFQNSQNRFTVAYHFAFVIVNRFDAANLNCFEYKLKPKKLTLNVFHISGQSS